MNAVEIEAAVSDLAALPFDAVEFPYAFLAAFGCSRLLISCQIRHGGRSAISQPMRYTAALVPIEDFEGKT